MAPTDDSLDRLQTEVKELRNQFNSRLEEVKTVRADYIPPGFTTTTYPHAIQTFNERWDDWKRLYGTKELTKEQIGEITEKIGSTESSLNCRINDLIKESSC